MRGFESQTTWDQTMGPTFHINNLVVKTNLHVLEENLQALFNVHVLMNLIHPTNHTYHSTLFFRNGNGTGMLNQYYTRN